MEHVEHLCIQIKGGNNKFHSVIEDKKFYFICISPDVLRIIICTSLKKYRSALKRNYKLTIDGATGNIFEQQDFGSLNSNQDSNSIETYLLNYLSVILSLATSMTMYFYFSKLDCFYV